MVCGLILSTRRLKVKVIELKMNLGYIGKPTLKQKKQNLNKATNHINEKPKSTTFQTKKLSYEKLTNIYQINFTWKYFPCVFSLTRANFC